MTDRRRFGGRQSIMPYAKAKDFRGTLSRLWKFFGMEGKRLMAVFALITISAVLGLLGPYLIGRSIDAMSPGRGSVEFGLLTGAVTALLAAFIADAGISFIQGWLMAGISQSIVRNLRSSAFSKLQKLPIAYFDSNTHGEIMSRLSNDIDNISVTISQATTQLMMSIITVMGSLSMMFFLSPVLTLASVIIIPLVFILTGTIAKKTRKLFREQQAALGRLNGHIEETISGFQVVKAFNHEEKSIRQFDEVNTVLCEVGIKAQIWSGYIMPLMNVINNLGFAMVAGLGGYLAVKDMVTVGMIASFLSYSRQFARPLNDMAGIFNTLQSAVAGAERVFEILDEKEEQEDVPEAVALEKPKGHVVFENVTFSYRKGEPILKNVSFEAEAGSSIALVGRTGAGKTTIVNLLTRFYDTCEGRILIDGLDIRRYTRDSLRQCFGIVLQDTYLFSGTIKENIKYGRLSATDEEVRSAASIANADTFIRRLPKGYDTELAESGGNLSQGQRQLLAIARAVLANPSILILDEATSSVDTRTELHIQEAMLQLMKGRTSFVIAHRLSTIKDAGTIMVIHDGGIAEQGSHRALIDRKGIYYRLYYSQFKNTE
jgi:ATP-binding cassette subfamily B protein